jgi:tetratricopeptide (TPR) repeat protein
MDPADPRDAKRLLYLLDRSPHRGPAMEACAGRCTASPDAALATMARIVLAECAADAGRLPDAERALRQVLSDLRGGGSPHEFYACRDLAWVFFRQWREVEALSLARRAVALAEAGGPPRARASALSTLAAAYRAMEDWERMESTLDRQAEAASDLPEGGDWRMRATAQGFRAEADLHRGDAYAALRHVEQMEDVVPLREPDNWPLAWPLALRAEAEHVFGREEECLALLGRARAVADTPPSAGIRLQALEVSSLFARGEDADATERARDALDQLERRDPDPFGAGNRLRFGVRLASILRGYGGPPREVRRALDMAATAAVDRLRQAARVSRTLPEVLGVQPEDLQALEAYRQRILSLQQDLFLGALAVIEEEVRQGQPPLRAGESQGCPASLCAWCRRVRLPGGVWVPLGVFLPGDEAPSLSHVICPDCLEGWWPALRMVPAGR